MINLKKYDTILTKEKYGDINSEILSNNTGYMKLRYYHKNSDIEVGSQEIQREINNLNTMSKEKIFDYLNNKYTPMISVERDVYKGFNNLNLNSDLSHIIFLLLLLSQVSSSFCEQTHTSRCTSLWRCIYTPS